MAETDLKQFRASMVIGYIEWHDGIGYDLDALGRLDPQEKALAEDLILKKSVSDWRDVEALDAIGSPLGIAAIQNVVTCKDLNLSAYAVMKLSLRKCISEDDVTTFLLKALPATTIMNGLVQSLRLAAMHPNEPVRRKLLWCARHGNNDIRVHTAALVHHLYGCSASPFDNAHQSLYVRFAAKDPDQRREAYRDLCKAIGVDENWAK